MWYPKFTTRFEVRGGGFVPFFTENREEAHEKAKLRSLYSNSEIRVEDNDTGITVVWFRGNRFDKL